MGEKQSAGLKLSIFFPFQTRIVVKCGDMDHDAIPNDDSQVIAEKTLTIMQFVISFTRQKQ